MKRRPAGAGSVYRRFQTWWIAYRVEGKLIRESTHTSVKTEAERILRERLHDVDTGRLTPEFQGVTLDSLETLVETDYDQNKRASVREVHRGFDRLRDYFGGDEQARKITVDRIQAYKAKRLEEDAQPATINRELASLRRGFRLAVKHHKLAVRPDFSLLTEDNARTGFFEREQLDAILQHLPEQYRAPVRFMYVTGWRKSEVFGLEWGAVDRKAGVIRIEKTKNKTPRTIPYAVVPELKAIVEEQHAAKKAREQAGVVVPWVFVRPEGNDRIHGDTSDFYPAWHDARIKAGLPGRIPHDFRRSAARNFLRAGIPQRVAMLIGGWKTDSVFRRYAIVDETMLAAEMKKLGASA